MNTSLMGEREREEEKKLTEVAFNLTCFHAYQFKTLARSHQYKKRRRTGLCRAHARIPRILCLNWTCHLINHRIQKFHSQRAYTYMSLCIWGF
jgi:hypothetical protein